jgi:hypothetical protein
MSTGNPRSSQFTGTLNAFATDTRAGDFYRGERGATLPERECVAFVRRDNAASLRAHLKMGMKDVASFEHDGVAHAVLAFAAPRRA